MKVYIELHSARDNRPILGNMDGQGVISWAKQYRRTYYYKSLPRRLSQAKKFRKDHSLFYKVVNVSGNTLEVIR